MFQRCIYHLHWMYQIDDYEFILIDTDHAWALNGFAVETAT